MQNVLKAAVLLFLFATQALAQVRVDVRLERDRYLTGEPITVVVDIENVGDDPFGYSACDGDIQLTVVGAQHRQRPDVFGCFSGMGMGGSACAVDHPPLLPPGQSTSFRYLLREYDLKPGQYELRVSGKAPVRWKYYPSYAPNVPAPPPPKHKETDSVPGQQLERTLSLTISPSTEDELKRAMAPLVADADAPGPLVRYSARAAIIESAPPFLEDQIARFAAEDPAYASAIDALGRLATPASRSHLKSLLATSGDSKRSGVVLALARIGHQGDAELLAGVLKDAASDEQSRRYAALGLGHIGGEKAVGYLGGVLPVASEEIRASIATSLGNTRSGAAVPVLISMYGNNPVFNDVCGALRTLTHRSWCDGSGGDPVAIRRKWLRWWDENQHTATIFGSDRCVDALPSVGNAAKSEPTEVQSVTSNPIVNSVNPKSASANTVVTLSGSGLGLEDLFATKVVFVQGDLERIARISGGRGPVTRGPDSGIETMDVFVPVEATVGRWQIVVEAHGGRSAPVSIDVTAETIPVLTGVSPQRPHPAQIVSLSTSAPAQLDDQVEMRDGRGTVRRIPTGVSPSGVSFMLPDDVPDGEATVRVGRTQNGIDRFSAPLKFLVTSAPLPLNPLAMSLMKRVAPGQWTDLVVDADIEFEIRRADRIEVEFSQGDSAIVAQASGPDSRHVQVPSRLSSGAVQVRSRTWIEQTASEWSVPTPFLLSEQPVGPHVEVIQAGPSRTLVWSEGGTAEFAAAKADDVLWLRGLFPVERAADLHVQLRSSTTVLDLAATDAQDGVEVEVPAQAAPGDWRLMIGTKDGLMPPSVVTTIHIM
jgi:hypothetical protein